MSFQVNDFANTAKWTQNIVGSATITNLTANSFQAVMGNTPNSSAELRTTTPQNLNTFDVTVKATEVTAITQIVVDGQLTNYVFGMARNIGYGVECTYGGGFAFMMPDPVDKATPVEMRVTRANGLVTWYYNGVQIAQASDMSLDFSNAIVRLIAENTSVGGQIMTGTESFIATGTTPPPQTWSLTVTAGTGGGVNPTTAGGDVGTATPTIAATALTGYAFGYWMFDGGRFTGDTTNPISIIIDVAGAHTLQAVFTPVSPQQIRLTVQSDPSGIPFTIT